MGSWSCEPFGSDTACDWARRLAQENGMTMVEATLDAVISERAPHPDFDLADEAVAAVEVIAKLIAKGTQADAYTHDVDRWVDRQRHTPSAELLAKARQALLRIDRPDSELHSRWIRQADAQAWHASLKQLATALGS